MGQVEMAAEVQTPRTAFLDPDFRKEPKGDCYCGRCQKALNGKKYRLAFVDWMTVIHPDDVTPATKGQWEKLGMDCAKIVGLEFTKEAS